MPVRQAPTVSVIIPFHDRDDTLLELLRSIPDMHEVEVIAINDHSTRPPTIPDVFDNADFHQIDAPDGQRYAGEARNQGMRVARGAYLFFADSDDLVETDAFRECVRDIAIQDQVDVIFGHVGSFHDGSRLEGRRHINVNWLLSEAVRRNNPEYFFRLYAPWGKFIRREFAVEQKLSFDNTMVSNDVIFNLQLCARLSSWRIRDEVIYQVREGNPSLTSSTSASKEKIRIRFDVQEVYNDGLLREGLSHLRSPGFVYVSAMWHLDRKEALHLAVRCLRGPTPFLALVTTLRFRFLRWRWRHLATKYARLELSTSTRTLPDPLSAETIEVDQ